MEDITGLMRLLQKMVLEHLSGIKMDMSPKNDQKLLDALFSMRSDLAELSHGLDTIGRSLEQIQDYVYAEQEDLDIQIENVSKGNYSVEKTGFYDPDEASINYVAEKWFDWAEEEERTVALDDMRQLMRSMRVEKNAPKHAPYHVRKYKDVDFGCDLVVPAVRHLKDITPCLHYYHGDREHPNGLYVALSKDIFVEVPFPDVDSGTVPKKILKCEHARSRECGDKAGESSFMKAISSKTKGMGGACQNVHVGEHYVKAGTDARCQTMKDLGRRAGFSQDIKKAGKEEIKRLMIYALSDILIAAVWAHQNPSQVLNNIDKCDN